MKSGLLNITPAEYHADPCPAPSLSSSIGKLLIDATPRHAWHAHPKLNPDHEEEVSTVYDIGSVAHTLMLRDERAICVIDAPDFRNKAAREQRDQAYADGVVPILTKHYDNLSRMVEAGRRQIAAHRASDAFQAGKPEQAVVAQIGGCWARCLLDWLHNDRRPVLYDYKTTQGSASPEQWQRNVFNLGFDFQAAFYLEVVEAALGIKNAEFRLVVQETQAPWCLSVVALQPSALDLARRKVREAFRIWKWCLERDEWPGYPADICYIDAPPWEEARQLTREVVRDQHEGRDLESMTRWQAPLEGK